MVREALGGISDVHRHLGLASSKIYELTVRVSALKVIALIINLAVVVYLLLAKRLFGLRGGARVDAEERARDTGWTALERSFPTG